MDFVRTARAKGAPERTVMPVARPAERDAARRDDGRHGHRAPARRRDLHRGRLRPERARRHRDPSRSGSFDLPTLQGVVIFGAIAIIIFSLDRRSPLRVDRPANPPHVSFAAMSEPLLDVRDLRTEFHTDDGIVKAVDGVELHGRAGAGARHRRRVRLGQERHLPHDDGPQRPEVRDVDRRGAVRGRGPPEGVVEPAPRGARQRDRDDLPGPDDVAEPGPQDRAAARRGRPPPPGRQHEGGVRPARSSS